jgi:hypothetical protein
MIALMRECAHLGCKREESAKDFADRDPVAAKTLADWIKAHPDCFNFIADALTKKQRVQS